MNCLHCNEEFDSATHIPRLLPHCGHTLCSVCVNSLINSNFIICTECKELNMAFKESDLPKNLAILRIQHDNKKTYSSNNDQSEQSNKSSTLNLNQERCLKHNKKLQAFCLQCFEYVCFQCVISHPKDHELKTLQQAIGYFKEQTKKIIKFYREMKLNYKMQRVELEKADVLTTINNHKAKIGKVFSEIKTYLEQKETEALSTLRSIYDSELARIAGEEKELDSLLCCYNKLVELSRENSLKNCIENFNENRNLFNFNKQKIFYQSLLKKEKMSAVNATRGDLLLWDDFFNKFKERISKDIRNMLDLRIELKQKTMGLYKTANISSNYLSNKAQHPNPKPSKHHHKPQHSDLKNKENNKQLHISLKQLDKFSTNPKHNPSNSFCNTSRNDIKNPLILYGGYSQDQDQIGLEIYGHPNYQFKRKFVSSSGHVKFGIAYIAGKIFVFGGKRDNKRLSEIYQLDSLRQEVKEVGHMTTPKSGFGYCKRGSCCYVVGGNDGGILSDFEEYDFINHQVKTLQRMTVARDELTAVLHKNEIFAIGGYNLDNELSLATVERYSFQTKKWLMGASLVIPRRSHGSISIDSGLYVVGGYDGKNYLSTIQKYNEIQCRWQIVCEMMEPRCTFGISENLKSDGFIIFGGFARQPLSTCQLFSSETRKFTPVADNLHTKRFMLAAIQTTWEV